jgi:hypothetical protein
MYWHIGRMIDVDVLREKRAGYDQEMVATLSPQLSWSHFRTLLPVPTPEARQFYIDQAVSARLSVRGLRELIGREGFERKEIANAQTPGGSMVPSDSFRDPYLLDFLGLQGAYDERDLEEAIVHDLESGGRSRTRSCKGRLRKRRRTVRRCGQGFVPLFLHGRRAAPPATTRWRLCGAPSPEQAA